ncbi:hypothetical protein [Flavisolibacter tropicus]|uniref:hypothetical protein n=1 Tax=Flavisolibacter tropicus TaxID=1492898 RepID=UPI0008352534|nr:hypothetical protein [Flavisolibacter tropicus]
MKRVIIPILILLLLAQTFSQWLIVLDYQINKDYIARVLCENKNRPKLKCNGKCQMMKKLAEEEKQQQSSELRAGNQSLIVSASAHFATLQKPTVSETLIEYQELPVPHTVTRSYAIFHPPATV